MPLSSLQERSARDFSSTVVEQIATVCRRHPVARKVLFVPYVQLGRALETALARREGRWGGIECHTPTTYARTLAETRLPPGHDELSDTARTLLVWSIARALRGNEPALDLDRPSRLAPQLADAIGTLRTATVAPTEVRRREEEVKETDGGLLPILAATYERYEETLSEHPIYDTADVFDAATEVVTSGVVASGKETVGNTIFATCGETDCHERALRLLRALWEQGAAFYRIGAPDGAAMPGTCAAALMEIPEDGAKAEQISPGTTGTFQDEGGTCRRAVGPTREVRGAFREILRSGVPLDEVEIAYTSSTPYLTRLADEAERTGVPITLGTGVPATVTRAGQALSGFFEWIQEGYPASVLIRLLRSGLLPVERWQEREGIEPTVPAHALATVLAARRYERGREGYGKALSAAIEEVDEEIRELGETGLSTGREEENRHRLAVARALVEDLLALVDREATAAEIATAGKTFLHQFGPDVEADGEGWALQTEEEKQLGQIALQVLMGTTLPELTNAPVASLGGGDVPASRMARFARKQIEEQYVGAQQPTPGAAHVLPLESAGFTGRSHLVVVGLDSDTASASALDGSLLSEGDREAFHAGRDTPLPEPRAAGEEQAWRFRTALQRHRGPKALIAMQFDPDGGEERSASSLYLEWKARIEAEMDNPLAEPLEGLRPPASADEDGPLLLSDDEAWLAATRPATASGDASARDRLLAGFPWIRRGEHARAQRRSEQYTAFDGLLPDEHPELDFLDTRYDGPPLSAARLQTLAEAPYAYFVKYVLGARPLDEPALEDEPWLTPLRKGSVLHRTYEQFMRKADWPLTEGDRSAFLGALTAVIDEEIAQVHPGSDAAEAEVRRRLREEALLFFESERRRGGDVTPLLHEWGFGYGHRRRREREEQKDAGRFALQLSEGDRLRLRGRIDRVDRRRADGTLAVWDYKTGSQSSFSRAAPLKHGEKLQWALYAFVLEQHRDEPVAESGYFFTSEKEMGTRLRFRPDEVVREELEEVLRTLASLARTGSFPMRPDADDHRPWKWGDYDRLVSDLDARTDQLSAKEDHYPGDRPHPHFLE
ncbi:PD-(D/E)XK nuclease family protein [Salinibacter ruber]|uniref:PD-(D/E)XK nuclease family protein n=1 Tax=Salinibacter ruber TaxID=146919 RepID=UPI002073F5ED|nr:PD-(D/E)XK nuclease family protein [Salinibacter ruber]